MGNTVKNKSRNKEIPIYIRVNTKQSYANKTYNKSYIRKRNNNDNPHNDNYLNTTFDCKINERFSKDENVRKLTKNHTIRQNWNSPENQKKIKNLYVEEVINVKIDQINKDKVDIKIPIINNNKIYEWDRVYDKEDIFLTVINDFKRDNNINLSEDFFNDIRFFNKKINIHDKIKNILSEEQQEYNDNDNNNNNENFKLRNKKIRIENNKHLEKRDDDNIEKLKKNLTANNNKDNITYGEYTFNNINDNNTYVKNISHSNQNLELFPSNENYLEVAGKPFDNPFEILCFYKSQRKFKILRYNYELIKYTAIDLFDRTSSYCNGNNHLYISGGESALQYFWDIDLSKNIINYPILIPPKKYHSMIFIPNNTVFIVGGNDKKVFYYNINTKQIIKWSEINKEKIGPALQLIQNKLYCFDNIYHNKYQNVDYTIEVTELNSSKKIWYVVKPKICNFIKPNKLNQKSFGVLHDEVGNILFLGGQINDYSNQKMNYMYNRNLSTIQLSPVQYVEFNLKEKTFYPFNKKFDFILTDFQRDTPQIAFFNKIKKKIELIDFESRENNVNNRTVIPQRNYAKNISKFSPRPNRNSNGSYFGYFSDDKGVSFYETQYNSNPYINDEGIFEDNNWGKNYISNDIFKKEKIIKNYNNFITQTPDRYNGKKSRLNQEELNNYYLETDNKKFASNSKNLNKSFSPIIIRYK